LNDLLSRVLPANRFLAAKLSGVRLPLASLEALAEFPFTSKEELVEAAQEEPPSTRTFPRSEYVRYHQTSGTRGSPLVVLDTAADWAQWIECWQHVYDAADVEATDTVFLAFSFGPFIGFWSAYDAACARGCLVVPGGGLGTLARLELARRAGATILCCTPSYALHLAEVAGQQHFDLAAIGIKALIVAGEPGGSVPAVRNRIERAFAAKVIDHAGATEVGPWGVGDLEGRGLHVLEHQFIAEFLSLADDGPAEEGQPAELVLTNLGRAGFPVIRYRTGDVVRPSVGWRGREDFVFLQGGVLGRVDDMRIVRGVNVFPSAVDAVVREFAEIVEYRATISRESALDEMSIEVEGEVDDTRRIAEIIGLRLGFRVDVRVVDPGTLPRFEGKGRRLFDER
jgi:phenylacetate-CoA ligase